MELIIYLYTVIDSFLMPFFRFPNKPLSGYFLGIFILSLICIIIGEFSIFIAYRANRRAIIRDNKDIHHFQDMSIKALKAGDKPAYTACNSIANDAFGKSFFSQIALSASSLWPLFIALGWMQYRFSGVEFSMPFSFLGKTYTVGYFLTFVFCYLITRIVFGKVKNNFSYRNFHV